MQGSDQVHDFKDYCAMHVPEKLCGQVQSPTGMHAATCMSLHTLSKDREIQGFRFRAGISLSS